MSTELPAIATVARIDPTEDPGWDAKVQAFADSSFFHTAAWCRVLRATYGYTPTYFTLSQAGHLQAVLPLMEVNSWLTGRRGIALPFTDDCEPLSTDAAAFRQVYQAATDHAKARDWKYLECRGGRAHLADEPASTAFYGHELKLAGGEETLFNNTESAIRRAVRKAEKSEVRVEVTQSLESVRAFYSLLCQTRRRHGVPPQPFEFFRQIQQHVLERNHGFVILARYQQIPVAGAIYFHWGERGIYKYGASDETYQHLRANSLVMWEAIKSFSRNGFKNLHFGRTSLTNEGLRRFKLSWGTEETMIEYTRFDCRQGRFVVARDEASGWHNRVFQVLPVALSRFIGTALYKHVA